MLAGSIGLSGCATLLFPRGPVLPEPVYTTGIPEEQPLPPIRTEGLTSEEIQDVTVYRNAVRAVVNVEALRVDRYGRSGNVLGSGFILDQDGTVVTNYHVVQAASRITITMYDGSAYRGTVVGYDPELDVAVLRFDPLGRTLTTLAMADSTGVQVGQRVYALGNPFGLEGSLSTGIVSGLNRPIPSGTGFIIRDLIQTDAAINTGNSGGPLLNSSGQVVGVNVIILSPSGGSVGVGFAIPSNAVQRVVRSILADGQVERGWIDISGFTVTPRLASYAGLQTSRGVLITRVHPGGNAASAGLRDGQGGPLVRYGLTQIPVAADIIVAINDEPLGNVVEFLSLLEPTVPGELVTLTVVRGGRRVDIQVELSERDD